MKKTLFFLFFLSIIYNLIFNVHIISGTPHFIAAVIIVFLEFIFLGLFKNLFTVFFPFIILVSVVAKYFITNFKILITTNVIGLLFETSLEEASGFIGTKLILLSFLGVLISIFIVIIYRKIYRKEFRKNFLIIILILLIFLPIFKKFHYTTQLLPHIIFEKTYKYALARYRFLKMIETKRKNFNYKYLTNHDNKTLYVVLVIGEAARADHFHINGYYRETSPELEKIKNLISFKKFYSCDITTRKSIPCFMTRATIKNREPEKREYSVITLFKKAGFYTYWISNQRHLGKYDTPVTVIAEEANYIKFNNPIGDLKHLHIYDENLFPILKKILKDTKHKKKLIILHTIGSHWNYEMHYPPKFRKFIPVCKKKSPTFCSRQSVINSYDNTILNTDYVLSKVIKLFMNKRAIVFYTSDHGESLGEHGLYGHGQRRTEEQTHIATFLWFSPKLLKDNFYKNLFLKAKIKENKKLTHDSVFYSLLGCSGIQSDIINEKLNICN